VGGTVSPASGLAELLAPTAVETFLAEHYGQHHFLQTGPASRFERLLGWRDLNRILADHRLEPPRLRLARDGVPVGEEQYARRQASRRGFTYPVLEPVRLREQLRDGATLVLDGVDQLHPPVRELAAGLERELGERVQVNLYASFHERKGFGLHWDDHDVLVLQAAGRKRWRVYGMTRRYPLHRDLAEPAEPAGEPVWEGFLEAGTLLHVPRGHWHDAMAGGEPSLHLTVGVIRQNGIDLLHWLADRLRGVEAYRRDLARQDSRQERRERGRQLRSALLTLWSEDLVDEFFDAQDAGALPRPALSLPWGVGDEGLEDERLLRANLPRRLTPRPHPDGVELRALGRSWVFAPGARPMLERLLDAEPHAVGELLALGLTGGREARRELLAFLCQEGLLTVL
jgi:hypothetical protein